LPALPLAALVLGNLWLSLPPARHWVEGKIKHRTGLETRVGNVSVTPWNGIVLRRVQLLQPAPIRPALAEPLASIHAIRLTPVWRSWLRGGRDIHSLTVENPNLVIPVEWLAEIARSQAPPETTPAPTLAAASPPTAAIPAPAPGPAAPASPAAPPAPTTTAPETTAAKPPAPPPLPPTGWLHLENASISLVSLSKRTKWFDLTGASGSIPVSGQPAQSSFRIQSIETTGHPILTDLNASLDWKFPLLSLQPLQTGIHGYQVSFAAKVAMLAGIPLQIEAQLPRQALASFPLPADGHAQAESVAANARFRGLLLAPGSWQGDLIAESSAPAIRLAGMDAKFDRASAIAVLRGGILSCLDARLIGDELSFLGNATLLADGRAAAALRMVAPPESANSIVRRVLPRLEQVSLTPLSSTQRAAFDLQAYGTPSHLTLQIGKDGPLMELKRAPGPENPNHSPHPDGH
jgi:hypothetical protein